jgi:hypothetical protein
LKVLISDIIRKYGKYGSNYTQIEGKLQSGLIITIHNEDFDLLRYKNCHVEMLLCVLRSPYLELERGIHNQLFSPEEYYSVELIDELIKQKGFRPRPNIRRIIITGEYIDSYLIPEKWIPLIKSRYYKSLIEEPSAIKTKDGIFLLNPFHLIKKVPIEQFPRDVTIAFGRADLVAWHPISQSTFTSLEN